MQFPGMGKPPVGIVFDSDMGNRIDTALAMALLYGLDGKNETRVVSISVSKPNLNSAALCEVIGKFYAGAVSGDFGASGRNLPTGMAVAGPYPEDTPMLTAPLAKLTADGKPAYSHGIHHLVDTAETPALIRNAFTSQYDGNCIAVMAGPASNYAKVLALPGIKELIAAKVRYLVVVGGAFGGGPVDPNVKADIVAANKVFAEWPGPIVAVGAEMAHAVLYPASSIEKDFTYTEAHPVVDAYRAYKAMPYDATTWDLAAMLYAIRPNENYFKLSAPGVITVGGDGRTQFMPSADGRHRYLIADPAQKDKLLKTYIELVSAKPVPRAPRFRRPIEQKKAAEAKKADEAKPVTPPKN